jgi:hypothetical protein
MAKWRSSTAQLRHLLRQLANRRFRTFYLLSVLALTACAATAGVEKASVAAACLLWMAATRG